jgi:hypothetical protein
MEASYGLVCMCLLKRYSFTVETNLSVFSILLLYLFVYLLFLQVGEKPGGFGAVLNLLLVA